MLKNTSLFIILLEGKINFYEIYSQIYSSSRETLPFFLDMHVISRDKDY